MKNNKNKIVNLFEKTNNKNYNNLIEKLYKEEYMRFYKVAYRILKNEADAKDAVNDSFVKSHKYIDKFFKMKCPEITAYFVYIVKSVSINIKKSQAKIFLSETSDNLIDRVSFTEGSDVILERMIENQRLNTLLDTLSTLEKNILEFKIIDRLTFKEISKNVGISEEAAKKRYQRILKKLQEKEKMRGSNGGL